MGFFVWFSFNANEFRRRKYLRLGYALIREKVDADYPKGAISIAQDENQPGKGEKTINAPLPSETPQTMVSPSLESQPEPVSENRPAVKAGQEAIGEPMTTGITREQESEFFAKALKEIEDNQKDPADWARAFAEAEGEEEKAKALYIKERVATLTEMNEREIEEQKLRENAKEQQKRVEEEKKLNEITGGAR